MILIVHTRFVYGLTTLQNSDLVGESDDNTKFGTRFLFLKISNLFPLS
jgi:hypothetical protein